MKIIQITIFILISSFILSAQVVTSIPTYATANDSIVVIFNATEGDGGLQGYAGDDVYAHTGVTIEGEGAWQYVIAAWDENLPKAKLTRQEPGSELWELNIGKIYEYYDVPDTLKITQLCFVFRNSDGSKSGRDIGGADIFMDLYEPGITAILLEPEINLSFGETERSPVFMDQNDTLIIVATAAPIGTEIDSLILFFEGSPLESTSEDTLIHYFISGEDPGFKEFLLVAQDTSDLIDSITFKVMINPAVTEQSRPTGVIEGINYIDVNTVTLSLFAPYKDFVYVIGDFNDWKVDENYYMKREIVDVDSAYYWLTISGLAEGDEYAFQYFVDGEIRVADPYTEKVLDPWDDQYIPDETYPNLKPYPQGKTDEIVSVLQTAQQAFQWQAVDYIRPEAKDLVIYEMLIRDFVAAHDYSTLIDTLDYFSRLGINAIELMPINEFGGNEGWGYNPYFYFAPDKYYGPKEDLKHFIDECHKRDIAVIIDMVLNHSEKHSPFLRLYNEGNYGKPTSENPWYNVEHNFENPDAHWGFDFNHESPATQKLVDRLNRYWMTEYMVDGFRFDFTKGFGNNIKDAVTDPWGSKYDADRVRLLKRMTDQIWTSDSTAIVIMEHLAENSEEMELANYGILLWGNMNYNYNEATMGWNDGGNSDFSWGYYKNRGWSQPNLVTYMESHDEERIMYKNLQYGNYSGSYDIRELPTALNRMKMAGAFFFTYPGPKMIWQFGELGYDYSIDYNGRLGNKPIRWDYYDEENRKKLYKTFAALLKLRNENIAFRSEESYVNLSVSGAGKRINIIHDSLEVTIIGNFDVKNISINPNFSQVGEWYDYFSGDTLTITSSQDPISLEAGEFHIYTDKKLEAPEDSLLVNIKGKINKIPLSFALKQNYPNPFNPQTTIEYQIDKQAKVTLKVFDILGRHVITLVNKNQTAGLFNVNWNGMNQYGKKAASGVYFYRLSTGKKSIVRKMLLIQ